jgi:uncharacterized protein (TIGR00661 family)
MLPNEIIQKRILISVLNWGMGHVFRSIGLIHQLLEQKNVVIIACSVEQEEIYNQYFDKVEFIRHDGYPFEFGGKGNFAWDLAKSFSLLNRRLKEERKEVETIVKKHQIDLILSDHRYGFRSDKIPSIFITHQFNLPVKWHQLGVNLVHRRLMFKFNFVWIMDYNDSRLAGKLSVSGKDKNVTYIGPYSRFTLYDRAKFEVKHDNVLIASGPQVYAQELVNTYFSKNNPNGHIAICAYCIQVPKGIEKISGNWKVQDEYILSAKKIISRSGYSTIMDLEILKCDYELIPTPGQAEQEYLSTINSSSIYNSRY